MGNLPHMIIYDKQDIQVLLSEDMNFDCIYKVSKSFFNYFD